MLKIEGQNKGPAEHTCPKCGFHGVMPEYRLPAVTVCNDAEKGTWYVLRLGEVDHPFDVEPSEEQIRELVEAHEAAAKEPAPSPAPRRSRKAADKPEAAKPDEE